MSRIRSSASSRCPTGFDHSMPYGSTLSCSPLPRPMIARPFETWSSVSAVWASTAGWWVRMSVTTTPTLIRSVAAPTTPIITSGSKYVCGLAWNFASGVTSSVQTDSGCQPIRWLGHQIVS
jgi:hypothetical protein